MNKEKSINKKTVKFFLDKYQICYNYIFYKYCIREKLINKEIESLTCFLKSVKKDFIKQENKRIYKIVEETITKSELIFNVN